jgi:arabinose-5-phosphate isomerase
MTLTPIIIEPDSQAVEAAKIMEQKKITFLAVTDTKGKPIGILHIHDLLAARVI